MKTLPNLLLSLCFINVMMVKSQSKESAEKPKISLSEFHKIDTEHYTLFCKDTVELREGQMEIESAYNKLHILLGKLDKIVVIVTEEPEQIGRLDISEYTKNNIGVLPMISKKYLAHLNEYILPMPEWGCVISKSEGIIQVSDHIRMGLRLDVDFIKNDILVSVNGESITSIPQLKELYRKIEFGTQVTIKVMRDGKLTELSFNKRKLPYDSTEGKDQQVKDEKELVSVLAHEAGHFYFMQYVDSLLKTLNIKSKTKGKSGHWKIEDWMDEFAAQHCEFENFNAIRYRQMIERIENKEEIISLKELLTMQHLHADEGNSKNDENLSIKIGFSSDSDGEKQKRKDAKSYNFYLESFTFGEYLLAKEGPEVFKLLVEASLRNKSLAKIIIKCKNIPHTLPEIEEDWKKWVLETAKR